MPIRRAALPCTPTVSHLDSRAIIDSPSGREREATTGTSTAIAGFPAGAEEASPTRWPKDSARSLGEQRHRVDAQPSGSAAERECRRRRAFRQLAAVTHVEISIGVQAAKAVMVDTHMYLQTCASNRCQRRADQAAGTEISHGPTASPVS